MPDDDIALLNQLRRDGEISEEQYETLRRHVLWGTPLPELLEETLGGSAESPSDEAPADDATVELPDPGRRLPPPEDGRTVVLPSPPAGTQPPRRFTPTLPNSPTPPAGNRSGQPGVSQPSRVNRPPVSQPPRVNQPPVSQPPRVNQPPAANQPPAGNQPPAFRPRTGPGAPNVPPPAIRPPRPPYSGPPRMPSQRPAPPPAQPPTPPPAPQGRGGSRMPLIAGGAVLVVLLAALGTWWFALRGGDDVSPTKYASTVCPDLTSWQRDIAKSAGSMTTAVNNVSDATTKQKAAESFFTNAGSRTDQLVTALKHDAAPGSAKSDADKLVQAAKAAASSYKSSAQQTGELETSASSFLSGLQVIIRDPQQPVDAVRQVMAKTPGDLGRAYRSESSCSGLRLPGP